LEDEEDPSLEDDDESMSVMVVEVLEEDEPDELLPFFEDEDELDPCFEFDLLPYISRPLSSSGTQESSFFEDELDSFDEEDLSKSRPLSSGGTQDSSLSFSFLSSTSSFSTDFSNRSKSLSSFSSSCSVLDDSEDSELFVELPDSYSSES